MLRPLACSLTAVLAGLAAPSAAFAQCQLANPSFELIGQNGNAFAGWEQFGNVGVATDLTAHGALCAWLSGNDTGDWNVSGFWQILDTVPGERWRLALRAGHNSADPLTGDTAAFVSVEWRDAAGELISSESHGLADAATPTDRLHPFTIDTDPAPAGAAYVLIVPALLQGPTSDSGSVRYDLIEFNSLNLPTIDDIQWNDFPGGRTLAFSGHAWRVKGPGWYGPGPSLFADSPDHVWVDAQDRLHMTIKQVGGSWYSTEITAEDPLGYGDYIFTLSGRPDLWADNVVLGLFTFQYPVCWDPANPWNLHNEFDIEISRWDTPGNDMGQFVAQPWDYPGNIDRYAVDFTAGGQISHAFRWLPNRVECRAWRGGPTDESPATLIHAWTYYRPHNPRPEQPRVHINFWQLNGPPANGADHEAIVDAFTFIPSCADAGGGAGDGASDFPCFAFCLSGPETPITTTCAAFDFDADDDADLHDAAAYQRGFDAD